MKPLKSKSGYYDDYKLSTGKLVLVNCSILGINPNLELYEGYDGGICEEQYTLAEKMEIAEYALALWQKYWSKCQNELDKISP